MDILLNLKKTCLLGIFFLFLSSLVNAGPLKNNDISVPHLENQDTIFGGKVIFEDGVIFQHAYWEDMRTPIISDLAVSGKEPTLTQFKNETYIYAFANAVAVNENSVVGSIQMSHTYLLGSPILCHIHWTCGTSSTNNVTWGLEYTSADLHHIFPSTKTMIVTAPCGIAYNHSLSEFGNIGNFTMLSGIINYRLYRASSLASDTYTGNDVFGINFDCHYQRNTIGSYEEYYK